MSGFQAELVEQPDEAYQVEVRLGGNEREIIDVLNALEQHVTSRRTGPARPELNGRSYVLHAVPALAEEELGLSPGDL